MIQDDTPEGIVDRPTGPLAIERRYAQGGVPERFHMPETTLFENLEIAARRFPEKIVIHFYGRAIAYGELLDEVQRLAGYLQVGS